MDVAVWLAVFLPLYLAACACAWLSIPSTAVKPDEVDHIPAALDPQWRCASCGYRWPCASYKVAVWRANRGRRRQVAEVMAGWMELATHEILLSAAEYQTRFVAWVWRYGRPEGRR